LLFGFLGERGGRAHACREEPGPGKAIKELDLLSPLIQEQCQRPADETQPSFLDPISYAQGFPSG
jgi:hypothetical protein